MKHSQQIILVFGLVAAILGIYYADTSPFTHIAAAAVGIATIVGLYQAFQDARDAAFVQQTLSHLVRSIPPGYWWKEKVADLINQTGRSKGYTLNKLYNDKSDPRDADAQSVFIFSPQSSESSEPSGLLVLTLADYRELSLLGRQELGASIAQLMFSPGVRAGESIEQRITDTLVILYQLPRINQGFKVSMQPHDLSKPLSVEVGHARLSFEPSTVQLLLTKPPIERDLFLAGELMKFDVELSKYVSITG
tara:strand:- start:5697 stop:6446 length:750 start_codon:yes stop_codon:yes gene_type:complete